MADIDSKRVIWVLGTIAAVAMGGFMYMVVIFFRLDWVRYDTVDRYWKVEAMKCVDEPVKPVILLLRQSDANPDILIRFNRSLYNHLKKQESSLVEVNRKKVGYIREWDYGIIVPLSIEGKHVSKMSLMSQDYLSECEFYLDKELEARAVSTRRKMR